MVSPESKLIACEIMKGTPRRACFELYCHAKMMIPVNGFGNPGSAFDAAILAAQDGRSECEVADIFEREILRNSKWHAIRDHQAITSAVIDQISR